MGQIDSFKKVLGLDIEEVDPYKRILEESKAIEAEEGNGDEEEKKASSAPAWIYWWFQIPYPILSPD